MTPENGITLLGVATDLPSLSDFASETAPEVVLMDAELLANEADEYMAKIAELFPNAHVFIVTEGPELEALRRAQQRPAIAIIAKDAEAPDVLAAIRHAEGGAIMFHREFSPALVRQIRYFARSTDGASADSPLTPRETEVLTMLSHGTHVDGIARALGLSVHTVRGHVKNILAKLDSHSQLEAVAKAKQRGWVTDPV